MPGRLSEAEKGYYKRVEDALDEQQEEGLFLGNVIGQVLTDGASRVCCDKDGSQAVEKLLHHLVLEGSLLQKLLEALTSDFWSVARDRCGSHIIEALLKAAAASAMNKEGSKLQDVVLDLCASTKDHLPEMISHAYASHVLSSVLQVLAGVYVGGHVTRSRYSQGFRRAKIQESSSGRGTLEKTVVSVPSSFLEQLDSFAKRVSKLPNLAELLTEQCGSPVLQVLLRVLVLRLPTRGQKILKKIIKTAKTLDFTGEDLPSLFSDVVGSHTVGTLIELASPELHQRIYDTCIRHRVMKFALHPVANYPLQQFMASANSAQVSMLVDELLPLEEILFAGHTGVVVRLLQAAGSCHEKQASLLQELLRAFHTDSAPRGCVPLFLSLTTSEVCYGATEEEGEGAKTGEAQGAQEGEQSEEDPAAPSTPIHLHGSLIVQALLKFQDTKLVVDSLLHMTTNDIIRMSCDPSGSHVVEAFMSSRTVPVKKKRKLTEKLKTLLLPLSKDTHGSRVVDALWQHCEVGRKESLARELMAHEEELSADFYGRIVLRNCNIAHYKKKQAAWQEVQNAADKRRQLFQDIISEPEAGTSAGPVGVAGGRGTGKRRRGQQSSRKEEGYTVSGEKEANLAASDASKKKKSRRKSDIKTEIPVKRKLPLFESDNEEEGPTKKKRLEL